MAVTSSTRLVVVRSLVARRSSRWAESMREPQPWDRGERGRNLGVVCRKFSCVSTGWCVFVIYVIVDNLALEAANFVGYVGSSEAVVPDFLTSVFSRL